MSTVTTSGLTELVTIEPRRRPQNTDTPATIPFMSVPGQRTRVRVGLRAAHVVWAGK